MNEKDLVKRGWSCEGVHFTIIRNVCSGSGECLMFQPSQWTTNNHTPERTATNLSVCVSESECELVWKQVAQKF